MLIILAAGVLIPAAQPVYADGEETTVEVQPDGDSMKDTYILSSLPDDASRGAETVLYVGENNGASDDVRRSLLQWDFSGLPKNINISSAMLSLWVTADNATNDMTIDVFPIKKTWSETTATTWNDQYYPTIAWETAGMSGTSDASDVSVVSGSPVVIPNDTTVGTRIDIPIDATVARDLIRGNYYGVKIQSASESDDMFEFASSDNATAGERPMFTVTYTIDEAPPIDPGWLCVSGDFGGYLNVYPDCPGTSGTVVSSPFHASDTTALWTGNTSPSYLLTKLVAAKMQCEPYPGCQNDQAINYEFSFDISWASNVILSAITTDVYVTFVIPNGTNITEQVVCTSVASHAGTCNGTFTGVIPVENFPEFPLDDGYTIGVILDLVGSSIGMNAATATWDLQLSVESLTEGCASTYTVPVIDNYVIDPTIETPLGPDDPTTPDDQIYTTVADTMYRVLVKDGPWFDPLNEKTSAAVSFNGTDWMSWNEFETLFGTCVDTNSVNADYDVIYFTATTTTFYIRAADIPDEFSDNTQNPVTPFSYSIGIAFPDTSQAACDSQFSYDTSLTSVPVHGNLDDVQATQTETLPLVAGGWYAIEINSGNWFEDGGAGSGRIDLEFKFDNGLGATNWQPLDENSPLVFCKSSDWPIYYIQAPGNENIELHLRVHDQDDPQDWTDNTGTVNVIIYAATFNRTPTGCELQFDVNQMLSSYDVAGNASKGISFVSYPTSVGLIYNNGDPLISVPTGEKYLVPGGWYAIETTEGPWWSTVSSGSVIANTQYYNMEIKVGSNDWVRLSSWSGATCIVDTDSLGHKKVYFQVPEDFSSVEGQQLALRVATNAFMFTRGGMHFDLYSVTDYGYQGTTGSCSGYKYDPNASHSYGSVNAKSSGGDSIMGLSPGGDGNTVIYAIQIESANVSTDAPYYKKSGWFENAGATESDALQLTTNGTNFTALPNAPGVLCYFTTPETGELVIFVRPQNGQTWKFRADSTSFEDNTGEEIYTVYTAVADSSVTTWDSCIKDYAPHLPPINPHQWIPVEKPEGILVASLAQYAEYNGLLAEGATLPPEIWKAPESLGYYVIEIEYGSGPWKDPDATHYDAQLSNDGGATWHTINATNEITVCSSTDQLRQYWKTLVHVQAGEVWKIRVADTGTDTFADNTGSLAYVLYTAGGFEVPPSDNSNIGAINVQGGGDVCDLAPIYPSSDSITDFSTLGTYFGGWIDYLNTSVERYMAFCPRHVDMFFTVFDLLKKKEPFATLSEFATMEDDLKREVQSYGWDGEGKDFSFIWGTKSPAQIQSLINTYVTSDGGASDPWAEGADLVNLQSRPLPSSYGTCVALLPEYKRFAEGLCFASSMMKETSAQFWIQLSFDISAFFITIWAIVGSITSVISMATGVSIIKTNVPGK